MQYEKQKSQRKKAAYLFFVKNVLKHYPCNTTRKKPKLRHAIACKVIF